MRRSILASSFGEISLRGKPPNRRVWSLRSYWSPILPIQIKRFLLTRPIRVAASLLITGAFLLSVPCARPQDAQELKTAEYRAKAAFLANFAYFVEWPGEAFPTPEAPLLICVNGEFSFGSSLAERTGGVSFQGRHIQVRWLRKGKMEELRPCHILFVSRSEAKRYPAVLGLVRGASTLTVGETPDFLTSGGAVSFSLQQDSLAFEVNLDAVDEAHLRISSKLLALAKRVLNPKKAAQNQNEPTHQSRAPSAPSVALSDEIDARDCRHWLVLDHRSARAEDSVTKQQNSPCRKNDGHQGRS
jgi:YfiR/HmsC-like